MGFLFPTTWLTALWNILACYIDYKYIKQIEKNPIGVYSQYKESLIHHIIILGVNISLGAVIGVIPFIYDLLIRNYVIKNKDLLLYVEAMHIRNREKSV